MYELIIIWCTGEKQIYTYKTLEGAIRSELEFVEVFGNQIEWHGTRRKQNG